MPKYKLMKEQWDDFEKNVFNEHIHPIQRKEMKRAFYAGAQAIMFRIIQVLAPESEVTEQDLEIMEDLHKELQQFAKDIKEGRA